jgi:multiple sugar transport system substrate-binding protein
MNDRETQSISRRSLLKGTTIGAGVLALGTAPAFTSEMAADAATYTVSVGSNNSDAPGRKTDATWIAAAAKAGINVKLNTVDHNTFQNNISQYLQGTPDNVFTWFSGYRMKFFANKGLLTPIDDVWSKIGSNFSGGYKGVARGDDKRFYLVPTDWYPWGITYRASTFKKYNVDPASIKTLSDLLNACKTFKSGGIQPIVLGDKGQWEAMGTFDFVNMRTNGFQFHVDLTGGKAKWTDPRIQKTFANMTALNAYTTYVGDEDWDGTNVGQAVLNGKAAMQVIGGFASSLYKTDADLSDFNIMPFPQINPAYGINGIEVPIDGYLASNSAKKNLVGTKALMTFIGSLPWAQAVLSVNPGSLYANNQLPAPTNSFALKQVALAKSATNFSQFFDRDSRPDFAYPTFGTALQTYYTGGDTVKIAADLQKQWDALPPA